MGGSPENLVARIFKKMSFKKCVTLFVLFVYLDTMQYFDFAAFSQEVILLPDPEERIAVQIRDFELANLQCSRADTAVARPAANSRQKYFIPHDK